MLSIFGMVCRCEPTNICLNFSQLFYAFNFDLSFCNTSRGRLALTHLLVFPQMKRSTRLHPKVVDLFFKTALINLILHLLIDRFGFEPSGTFVPNLQILMSLLRQEDSSVLITSSNLHLHKSVLTTPMVSASHEAKLLLNPPSSCCCHISISKLGSSLNVPAGRQLYSLQSLT